MLRFIDIFGVWTFNLMFNPAYFLMSILFEFFVWFKGVTAQPIPGFICAFVSPISAVGFNKSPSFPHGVNTNYIVFKTMYNMSPQVLLSYINGITYENQFCEEEIQNEKKLFSQWTPQVQTMNFERLTDTCKSFIWKLQGRILKPWVMLLWRNDHWNPNRS